MSVRKIILGFLVLAAAAASPVSGTAQSENTTAAAEKPRPKTVSGTVNEVNAVSGLLRITSEQGYLLISVPDGTPITRGTQRIHLDEVSPNDSLLIRYYNPEPGKYVAVSIADSTSENG